MGLFESYEYNKNDQLLSLSNLDGTDNILSDFEYTYSDSGNILSKKEKLGTGTSDFSLF